ncbi:MAG: nucleotidyltransferase [Proteobacteria bacterium]|nr:nucleotidyltransferase [Pseudomonadota bacterium]
MPIPDQQLEIWSRQGAVAESRDTYATIKRVLEHADAPYHQREYVSFLQGSYGNDTNVIRDSDVDVAMRLDSVFYHDAHLLPTTQHAAFQREFPGQATYSVHLFKREVTQWLSQHFEGVRAGSKAIFVPGSGRRRDCDVLACARFNYYYAFNGPYDQNLAEGICFFLDDGTQVVNFPNQHAGNCTTKHQATNQWFKSMVRLYKNMRNQLVERRMLNDGVAPSYFVEGLLWNVPNAYFGGGNQASFVSTFNYLFKADRSGFLCANGIHKLFETNSHTSWNSGDCQSFLNAVERLWNEWR